MLPKDATARKQIPVFSGLLKYFPRALAAVAHLSFKGNEQHNPGEPLHWAKEKSKDHQDALLRHMLDELHDPNNPEHATAAAWRALAHLETVLEGLRMNYEEKKPDPKQDLRREIVEARQLSFAEQVTEGISAHEALARKNAW